MSECGAATHLDLSTISVGTLEWNWWLMWLPWKLFNFNTCPAVGVGLPQLCCLFTYMIVSGYQPSQFITIYLLDSFQSKSLMAVPKPARHNYASLFHQLELSKPCIMSLWSKSSCDIHLHLYWNCFSFPCMWTSVRGNYYMKAITPTEGFWLLNGFSEIL